MTLETAARPVVRFEVGLYRTVIYLVFKPLDQAAPIFYAQQP
jgi:hypothetical protein